MKRIAMFIHHETGGAVVAFKGFMRILTKNGYRIDLYRFNKAGENFSVLSENAVNDINYSINLKPRVVGRLPLLREYVNLFRYWQNLGELDRASKKMAAEIDSKQYEFAFINADKFVKHPFLLKYLKTRTYYFCNEPERRFYDPPSLFEDDLDNRNCEEGIVRKLQRIWYQPASKGFNYLWKRASDSNIVDPSVHIIANSYFTAESIFRAYNKTSSVCYLGVELRGVPKPFRYREHFVLTVGSLQPNKGHSFLVKALSEVPERLRPRLIVVTDVSKPLREKKLREMARSLSVEVKVKVQIPLEELHDLYSSAKLFVYGSRLEPFGLAPLEAMGFGTPVVAVQSGGVRETVKNGVTGLLSDWDKYDFSGKVSLLLENEDLWTRMSLSGHDYVRGEWTWDRTHKRFEEIVNRDI
jgi:glycosyltransferase involved in cell wall biosynthesis